MPAKHVRFADTETPSPSWSTTTLTPSPSWSASTLTSSPPPAAPPALPHKLSPYGNSPLPPLEPELPEEYVAPNPLLGYSPTPTFYINVAQPPEAALQRMTPAVQAQPATCPAVARLTLVTHALPWRITVKPRSPKPSACVTVADVVAALAGALARPAEQAELLREDAGRQMKIHAAWEARARQQKDAYMRRVDWLEGRTVLLGLSATQQHGVWAFHMGH
ncbi:hypothetical protein HDZ31DRAFT_59955 [Schizophyllum fasciatum]